MSNARTTERLLDGMAAQDAAVQLYGEQAQDIRFLHVVMAQCGLPYRDPGAVPFYQRKNGTTSLLLTPGHLLSPKHEPVLQGLPYGQKPRLLMLHLCSEAIRTQSPTVEVGDSMSALMHDLGLAVTGGNRGSIRPFKEQLNRLAATRVQFGRVQDGKAKTISPTPMIESFDVWFPKDAKQRVLWPTSLRLSTSFYESLLESALPLDLHAVRSLQTSSMALDCYSWLAHRLCRVPANKPALVSWDAIKQQFGQDYADTVDGRKGFKRDFRHTLAAVQLVYRDARIAETADGRLELRKSKPPVARTIEGKSTERL